MEKVVDAGKITNFQSDALSIVFPMGEQAEVGFLELIVDPKPDIIPERNVIKSQVIKQGLIVFIFGSILLLFVFGIFLKDYRKLKHNCSPKPRI